MFDIKQNFLFDGLRETEKENIIKDIPAPEKFKKGEQIYTATQYRQALGIIICGSAAAYSGKVIKRTFTAGDTFGAAAVFGSGDGYISDISATGDTQIVFITQRTLEGLFNSYPQCAVNYIRFLSQKVCFLNKRLAQFTASDTQAKLYRFLVSSADDDGRVCVKSMTALAKLTGMGRTSLYRALDALTAAHVIEKNNNIISIVSVGTDADAD